MPAPGKYVTVYLVDDHAIVRQGLRDLLMPAPDINVVADSGLATGAASSILAAGADVMVLDVQLQDGNGVQVCRQVRAVDPSVKGLLLTSSDDDHALAAAVLAGADGFVVKLARGSDIIGAIRGLAAGRRLIGDDLMAQATSALRDRGRSLVPQLTDHETAILDAMIDGLTDSQLADALGLDLAAAQAHTAGLIDRMLFPVAGSTDAGMDPPTGGKHRRAT